MRRARAVEQLSARFRRAYAAHRRAPTARTWFRLGEILAEAYTWSRDSAQQVRDAAGDGLGVEFHPIYCWERCVALAPRHAAAWHRLAQRYVELDDEGKAELALRRAVRLDPRVAIAWLNLATIELRPPLDRHRIRRAERSLHRAIAADRRGTKLGAEPYVMLADTAEQRGDDRAALAWLATPR